MINTSWVFKQSIAFRLMGLIIGFASAFVVCSASAQREPSAVEQDVLQRAAIRIDLGANYYQQRNYAVALGEANEALRLVPEFAPAHGLLGLIYMALGENDKAETSFKRGLQIRASDADLNNNYGWFLCQTKRETQSISYFLNATRDPLYTAPSKAFHNAGICSMRTGKDAEAEGYFQRAFQLDPGNPVAMFNLAELHLRRGDFPKAQFHAQRLLATYEPSAQTLWLAVRVQRKIGDKDQTASLASQLRRLFPDSSEVTLLMQNRYE